MTTPVTSRILRWIPAALWAGAIFAVSSVPGSNIPGHYGTQAHFTEYAILAALVFFALRATRPAATAAIIALAVASAYGVTDEFHQSFVPLRTPDVVDWLVDTAGAAFGVGAALVIDAMVSRRRSRRARP